MPTSPLVTVVCLCYNHEKFVTESLQSVANQMYKNIEIIIVDNHSSDNSVVEIEKWLKDHPHISFFRNSENLGNTIAFNKIAQKASGEFLVDFATDDLMLPDMIEEQVQGFQKNPKAALVYGNALLVDENGKKISHFFEVDHQAHVVNKELHQTNYIHLLQGGNYMCSVSAMFRKQIWEDLGRYDENLFYEDLDFWLRLSKKHSIAFIDKPLVKKRVVSTSQSSYFYKRTEYAKKINASTYRILKKAYKQNETKPEFQALLKRVHHEIVHNLKLKNYPLLLKLLKLKFRIQHQIKITPAQQIS